MIGKDLESITKCELLRSNASESIEQTYYIKCVDGLKYYHNSKTNYDNDKYFKIINENDELVNQDGKLIDELGNIKRTINKSEWVKRNIQHMKNTIRKRLIRPIMEKLLDDGQDWTSDEYGEDLLINLEDYDTSDSEEEPEEGILSEDESI